MFSDHGPFIVGFSFARDHIAVAPGVVTIQFFEGEIEKPGYSHTRGLFRIKWTDGVDLDLLNRIVAYKIEDGKDVTGFWRS